MMIEIRRRAYVDVMKKIIAQHSDYDTDQCVAFLVRQLYQDLIYPKDRQLIELAFRPDLTQSDLDAFLKQWDIETADADRAAILAYTMKLHPELKFDDYTGPRLKGLLNFLRFQNLDLISHFSKIVRQLNSQNIMPVVLKGGAMRYMRPDLPRIMADIDILVHTPAEFNAARKVICNMGYAYSRADHSFDVHPVGQKEKGILDVHLFLGFLPKVNQELNRALFERAQKCRIFSVDGYVPSHEDMVFICLNNLTVNLQNGTSLRGLPYVVFDLMYLISSKPDFNWDIVVQDICITHTEAMSYLAMCFVNQIVPDMFPKTLLSDKHLHKSMENFIWRDKFYALYVHDVKYACKKMKFKHAVRHWADFRQYVRFKGQHFFTKRMLGHPRLIRFFFKLRGL